MNKPEKFDGTRGCVEKTLAEQAAQNHSLNDESNSQFKPNQRSYYSIHQIMTN